MRSIAVIIPTFQRPDSLRRAVLSILAQDDFLELVDEVAIVDNDPAGSARPTVEFLQRENDRVRYIHAPEAGVSNARNAGLASTSAPLIAFLDDDEEAPPAWLKALHDTHTSLEADVTFGPVRGRADAAAPWKRAYLEDFFSRLGPETSGLTQDVHGCGCTMMTRQTALVGPAPFDLRANETGGEDDRLFEHLRAGGRRFAWSAQAWVWEHAPSERQRAVYALKRGFGYGQTPTQIAARARQWPMVVKWVAVGSAQAFIFGSAALISAPFNRSKALIFADRAARGLGKVIWFKRLRFYGAAVRRRIDAAPQIAQGAPA